MTHRHIIRYLVGLAGLGLAILFAPQSAVESREAITQVEDYRLGSHPQSTRIIIQLSQDTPYRVLTNYADQKVVMWIRNATLNPKVQTITFRDKYLSQIQVQEIKKNVKFTLQLKSKNTRLVHFVKHQPEQIVIDLKSNVEQQSLHHLPLAWLKIKPEASFRPTRNKDSKAGERNTPRR